MLNTLLGALEGLATLMMSAVGALLQAILDWFGGILGLPPTIPSVVINLLHSAAMFIDTFMPINTFLIGFGCLATLWLAWVAFKCVVLIVHWGGRILDWALSTGGVVIDTLVGAIAALLG